MRYGTCRVFCLPLLSGQCQRFRACIICRRKDLFNWNTTPLRSWETAQQLWRNSGIKLDRIISQVWKAVLFPSYLLFHLMEPHQVCYLWKAIPKAHPTVRVSWSEDQILCRTSANTEIVPLSSYCQYWCLST